METKANYTVIGLFTLAVITGVFGFVYWFQAVGNVGERTYYRVVFGSSVSGLRTGAYVLFNGIRVGEVANLGLDPQRPQQVVATISIDKRVPVHADTRVGLEFAGLTGVASLTLAGGNETTPVLAGSKENPPVLKAPPAASSDVTQAARDTMRRFNEFIEENRKAIRGSLENIDKFTAVLAENTERINSAVKNIDTFTAALARNSERFDKIAEGLQSLAGGADGKGGQINDAAVSMRRLSDTATQKIDALTEDAQRTLNTISRAANSIDRAARNFDANPSRLLWGGSGGKR